jgi:lysophospholipase L1-like esterase
VAGTLTYQIRLTVSGDRIRLRLFNEGGNEPLAIDAVTVATFDEAGRLGAPHPVCFRGSPTATLSVDAGVISDPVELNIQRGSDLVVSVYVSKPTRLGRAAPIPTLYTPGLNVVDAPNRLEAATTTGRPLITGVDVRTGSSTRVIVALGDSITDSNITISTSVRGWPEMLARMIDARGGPSVTVVNAGISGNRLRVGSRDLFGGRSALDRFDRDVLQVPGVTHVIIAEGINDIGLSAGTESLSGETTLRSTPRAKDLIDALSQLAARARARGLKVIGATITPFEGTTGSAPTPYYTPEKNAVRIVVNEWIRNTEAFDSVIDFDRAIRDPRRPDRIMDGLVGTDHLHPNSAGQAAMASVIDLNLFQMGRVGINQPLEHGARLAPLRGVLATPEDGSGGVAARFEL